VAVSGCGLLIYQAVDQFCQYDVITMTKIKRQTEMKLPAITICSQDEKFYDAIISCKQPSSYSCNMKNLTVYSRQGSRHFCIQVNNGNNVCIQVNNGNNGS